MPRRTDQTRRKRPTDRMATATGVDLALDNGPAPRSYYSDWPVHERRLLDEWNKRRDRLLADAAPERPWGYFWFDRAHGDTVPGAQRDALVAEGRLTSAEAKMMALSHTWHAFARVAASRPDQTIADWLADPTLIEKSIELVGWNPFGPETIGFLRRSPKVGGGGADARLTPSDPPPPSTRKETTDG